MKIFYLKVFSLWLAYAMQEMVVGAFEGTFAEI